MIAELHTRESGAPLLKKFGYNISVRPPVHSLGLGVKKAQYGTEESPRNVRCDSFLEQN